VRYYSPTVVRTLVVLSGNRCAYAGCAELLSASEWKQVNAEIAHIRGERPGSPRYDRAMSEDERTGLANLLLLCPNHHTVIDSLLPDDHPVEKLVEMKREHEEQSDTSQPWAPEEELTRFALLLMDRSGAIMIDWLTEDDAVEVTELKTLDESTTSHRAKKKGPVPRARHRP
jgi:hypothetical protein